jgi:hypothetical protein
MRLFTWITILTGLFCLTGFAWETQYQSGLTTVNGNQWTMGEDGKLELLSAQGSVLRAGAGTLLDMQSEQSFNLIQGQILLHNPSGQGGMSLLIGDTLVRLDGATVGFSVTENPRTLSIAVLDGKVDVTGSDQKKVSVSAGELLKVSLPATSMPNPVSFDVARLVQTSKLLSAFPSPFIGQGRIDFALQQFQNLSDRGFIQAPGSTASGNFLIGRKRFLDDGALQLASTSARPSNGAAGSASSSAITVGGSTLGASIAGNGSLSLGSGSFGFGTINVVDPSTLSLSSGLSLSPGAAINP